MKHRHVIVALAVSAAAAFGPAYGQTTQGQSVGAAIEQIASGLAGRIGFAAQEIGGDEVISFNGDETFAMPDNHLRVRSMSSCGKLSQYRIALGSGEHPVQVRQIIHPGAPQQKPLRGDHELSVPELRPEDIRPPRKCRGGPGAGVLCIHG